MIDVTDPAWSSISGEPRTVLLAAPRSFCVGVDRAIEMVEYLLAQRGSDNSSNANRFVELCRRQGVPAHFVDDPFDIRPEWLAGSRVIGLSAATSTPECVVDDVVALLSSLDPLTIEGRETTREDTNFSLPPPVRPE